MEVVGVKNNGGSRAISEKAITLYCICNEVIIGLRVFSRWLLADYRGGGVGILT